MNDEMSFSDWLVTLLIAMIPVINIIMLISWAIGKKGPKSRRNFSRAYFIAGPVAFLLTVALLALFLYFFGFSILEYFFTLGSPRMY